MTKFLFWNLNKKPIAHLIATLAVQHDIDVVILAECDIGIVDILGALNANRRSKYYPLLTALLADC